MPCSQVLNHINCCQVATVAVADGAKECEQGDQSPQAGGEDQAQVQQNVSGGSGGVEHPSQHESARTNEPELETTNNTEHGQDEPKEPLANTSADRDAPNPHTDVAMESTETQNQQHLDFHGHIVTCQMYYFMFDEYV